MSPIVIIAFVFSACAVGWFAARYEESKGAWAFVPMLAWIVAMAYVGMH